MGKSLVSCFLTHGVDGVHIGAQHLKSTMELSVWVGDAVLCQITLTTSR